jgi:hypothetical protein
MTTDLDFRGWWFRGFDLIGGRALRLHLHRIGHAAAAPPDGPKHVFWAHVSFSQTSHIKFARCEHGAVVAEVAVDRRDDGACTYTFTLSKGAIAVTARDCAAITWRI